MWNVQFDGVSSFGNVAMLRWMKDLEAQLRFFSVLKNKSKYIPSILVCRLVLILCLVIFNWVCIKLDTDILKVQWLSWIKLFPSLKNHQNIFLMYYDIIRSDSEAKKYFFIRMYDNRQNVLKYLKSAITQGVLIQKSWFLAHFDVEDVYYPSIHILE